MVRYVLLKRSAVKSSYSLKYTLFFGFFHIRLSYGVGYLKLKYRICKPVLKFNFLNRTKPLALTQKFAYFVFLEKVTMKKLLVKDLKAGTEVLELFDQELL